MRDILHIPQGNKIEHTESPAHPQFHFEWHPIDGKVYIGYKPGQWIDEVFIPGDFGHLSMKVLAEHCDTHARFIGFVQTYLRGYRQCETDIASKLKSQRLVLRDNNG